MLGIAVYIWIRFEWQFGVGALVTLFHDVWMTLGFFSLTQLEFNLNVIAAILTIVGYSLNDTVVIYDRIRENLRKYRKMEIVPLLNLSLNETLSRTMVTRISILLALLALLILGPDVIFGLTIAIFIGIFVGTYSSIYISSPILVWLKVTSDSFMPKDPVTRAARAAQRGLWCPGLSGTDAAAGPLVQGFSANGFLVDGRAYRGLLLTPERATEWDAPALAELGAGACRAGPRPVAAARIPDPRHRTGAWRSRRAASSARSRRAASASKRWTAAPPPGPGACFAAKAAGSPPRSCRSSRASLPTNARTARRCSSPS